MIIGFTGKKQAGKDTAGEHLVQKYGFTKLSFAAKLKESAASCFGVSPDLWEKLKNDENACVGIFTDTHGYEECWGQEVLITVRQFLQNYGTEAHRDVFGDDFWVREALRGLQDGTDYVVTDCRYDNEAQAIRDLGGKVYVIERWPENYDGDPHASEVPVSEALISGGFANLWEKEALYDSIDTAFANGFFS